MPAIKLPNGEQRLLKSDVVRIGRDPSNDLVLIGDAKVSRSHAELALRDGQWQLIDLGSSNGTKVNGRRTEKHPLRDGDRILIGTSELVYLAGDDPNATEAGTQGSAAGIDVSQREREVLALVAGGFTDKEIGEQLFISASTVRSHLDRIGDKTGLRRRAELTRLALDLGLVR